MPRTPGWVRRPSTLLAGAVLLATGVTAAVVAPGRAPARSTLRAGDAALVDGAAIPRSAVDREVAAIDGQPRYAATLARSTVAGGTGALSATDVFGPDPDDALYGPPAATPAPTASATSAAPAHRVTADDLRASVLTRLIFVRLVDERLHGTAPTAAEQASARSVARAASGLDAAGHPVFDALPGWYRDALVDRGARAAALQRVLGLPTPDQASITAAYLRDRATSYTQVCFTQVVLSAPAAAGLARTRALLAHGGDPAQVGTASDQGCHGPATLPSDVQAALTPLQPGQVSGLVSSASQRAVFVLRSRRVQPLTEVSAQVQTALQSRGTEVIARAVQDQLAVARITIAGDLGVFQRTGAHIGVVPLAELTVAPGRGSGNSGPQQNDPFD